VLHADRRTGLGRQRRRLPGARLQARLLIDAQNHFVGRQLPGVEGEQMFFTRRQNSASRGTFGDSHRCFRHGLSLWLDRIGCTVWSEIVSTTSSATN
jgi:hypothetical protein